MTYNECIIFRNHLASFIKIMEQTPNPSEDGTMQHAVEMWEKIYPDSPILRILK